jgi:hypothetical protein
VTIRFVSFVNPRVPEGTPLADFHEMLYVLFSLQFSETFQLWLNRTKQRALYMKISMLLRVLSVAVVGLCGCGRLRSV